MKTDILNLITVYSRKGKRRHLVDANKYEFVSESKSLCGMEGSNYWIPNAYYWHGEKFPMCKKCLNNSNGHDL